MKMYPYYREMKWIEIRYANFHAFMNKTGVLIIYKLRDKNDEYKIDDGLRI